MARLKDRFDKEIAPRMKERFNYSNIWQVPQVKKVVINMGLGEAAHDNKVIEEAIVELGLITGQRPVITKAKKAIANFKIRKGSTVGCKVTLRKDKMYEFLDRLISIVIPRIKDFRGLSPDSFDGRGNYAFGLTEQIVFPEVDADKVTMVKGMDIIITTSAGTDDEAKELLALIGMPFRKTQG
ncbi:MAG: 50S ribosomal protein L5 [Candidatus Omnitrophica bacterium]|nr:50S ribosomal protein L5 [Candidatus Omnitrophota bacterium]MBU4487539.1 50S ribosomal protein L5 [Candidatus Omnitrophota bacterium]MCG2705779.1 50S ribosomal protein L5 [Candidatus Omnitrophota bacterium]